MTLDFSPASTCFTKQTANKTLQLTPSRLASLFHDRFPIPSTLTQELNPRSGQLSLAFGYNMKYTFSIFIFAFICNCTAVSATTASSLQARRQLLHAQINSLSPRTVKHLVIIISKQHLRSSARYYQLGLTRMDFNVQSVYISTLSLAIILKKMILRSSLPESTKENLMRQIFKMNYRDAFPTPTPSPTP